MGVDEREHLEMLARDRQRLRLEAEALQAIIEDQLRVIQDQAARIRGLESELATRRNAA